MNSSTLHSILENPSSAGKHERELSSTLKDYPWFSAAHILLAKGMHQNASVHYDDQLHLSAVYAGERKVLFDLIMKAIDEDPIEISSSPEEKQSIAPETQSKQVQSEKITPIDEQVESVEPESIEKKDELFVKEDIDDLEKEIIVGAVSSSIEKEVEEDSSELRSELSENTTPLIHKIREEEEEDSYSEYTSWLLNRSKQIEFIEAQETTNKSSDPIVEEKTEALGEKDILDRFIKNNPHISRGKIDDFTTDRGFKESFKEDESLITETMAQIYAQQGKILKAKKAYKLLSLKYPEKSIYFAGRIKNLEGKK